MTISTIGTISAASTIAQTYCIPESFTSEKIFCSTGISATGTVRTKESRIEPSSALFGCSDLKIEPRSDQHNEQDTTFAEKTLEACF